MNMAQSGIAHNTGTFEGHKGLRLFYQCWLPEKEPLGGIVMVHGVGEHSSRYYHAGERFAGLGYAVYAYDQRGHGRSPGRRGHIRSFDEYILDLKSFIEYLPLRKAPFLLGHSLGGLIAIRYALDYPNTIKGIIASSPSLGLSMKVPAWKKALSYFLCAAMPGFTLTDDAVPSEYLSHDPKIARAYDTDPLVHRKRSTSFVVEFFKTARKTARSGQGLKAPCLLLLAQDDRIASAAAIKEFYENIPPGKKTLKAYKGFYHEILNEVGKDKAFNDIAQWLANYT